MKISIIVPVFNCEKYLKKSIESILNQDFSDFELILVNNGSKDNSLDICNSYKTVDNRIIVVNEKVNVGAGAARNIGIDISKGKYIVFLDADDWYEHNLLSKMFKAIESVDVAICGYQTFVEGITRENDFFLESENIKGKTRVSFFFANTFPEGMCGFLWNKIYKSEIIKKNNIRFPETVRLEDGFFNVDYFSYVESCNIISDVLYHYRLSTQSDISRKYSPEYLNIMEDLTDKFVNTIDFSIIENISLDNLYKFYINEFTTCLEAYFLEKDISKKRKWEVAINEFITTEKYREAKKHKQIVGKYRRVLFSFYDKRLYLLVELIINVKTFAKKNLKSIFYKLKK